MGLRRIRMAGGGEGWAASLVVALGRQRGGRSGAGGLSRVVVMALRVLGLMRACLCGEERRGGPTALAGSGARDPDPETPTTTVVCCGVTRLSRLRVQRKKGPRHWQWCTLWSLAGASPDAARARLAVNSPRPGGRAPARRPGTWQPILLLAPA